MHRPTTSTTPFPYTTLFRSEGVADRRVAEHLVVANQAGKDGQTRRVGAGPAVGTARVRVEEKDGAGACLPPAAAPLQRVRSEEHTSELQSHHDLVCRLLLEK